jgi:hypothetical protein
LQAQLKTAQANTRPKFLIELTKPTQEKIVFKNPNASKKNKNATHSRYLMTQKLNIDNGLQGRWTRTTAHNLFGKSGDSALCRSICG